MRDATRLQSSGHAERLITKLRVVQARGQRQQPVGQRIEQQVFRFNQFMRSISFAARRGWADDPFDSEQHAHQAVGNQAGVQRPP